MEKLQIRENADVLQLLHKAMDDVNYFEDKQIEFDDSFGKLVIHLDGEKFDSSITTGMMKGVLALQDSIYKTYAFSVYGENKKLTLAEKKEFEISVKIEKGSSILKIDIQDIITAMAERIKAMTGKEIIATVAIVSIATTLVVGTAKYIDSKTEIEKLRIQSATITDVQKNTNEMLIGALEAQTSFYRAVSKQSFDELLISGEQYTPADVYEVTKVSRERKPIITKLYSDDFMITDIHFENDAIYLDIIGTTSSKTIKHVNIFKEHIDNDDYQWFKDSTNQRPIKMNISATEKNDEIIAASLVSFTK